MRDLFLAIRYGMCTILTANLFLFAGSKAFATGPAGHAQDQASKFRQFGITDIALNPIDMDILGAENEGLHIDVYFEAKMKAPPQGLIMRNTIMQDVYADQINQLNIHFGNTIKSAVFARGDQAKKVLA